MSSVDKILASIERQHNKGSISSQEYIDTILDLSTDINEILASIERQNDKGALKAKDHGLELSQIRQDRTRCPILYQAPLHCQS